MSEEVDGVGRVLGICSVLNLAIITVLLGNISHHYLGIKASHLAVNGFIVKAIAIIRIFMIGLGRWDRNQT